MAGLYHILSTDTPGMNCLWYQMFSVLLHICDCCTFATPRLFILVFYFLYFLLVCHCWTCFEFYIPIEPLETELTDTVHPS